WAWESTYINTYLVGLINVWGMPSPVSSVALSHAEFVLWAHSLRISLEKRFTNGGVCLDYLSFAPTGTSWRKPANTAFPPSIAAATIIPFDSRPRRFLGSRLATMTTFLPISDSGA